jgi:uncharacterized phiE125 gp8 family phage protein
VQSVLLVAPAFEPLTLDEAKLRAGLDWPAGDPRDALMTSFIHAARQKVEQDTGLALCKQTRQITIAIDAGSTLVLPLPTQALPLLSVTDPLGRARHIDRALRPAALTLPDAVSGEWTIESGWPDAATLAAEAPLLVHAVGLLCAHYATLGRDLAGVGHLSFTVPQGYDDAIDPFRLVWVI